MNNGIDSLPETIDKTRLIEIMEAANVDLDNVSEWVNKHYPEDFVMVRDDLDEDHAAYNWSPRDGSMRSIQAIYNNEPGIISWGFRFITENRNMTFF